MPLQIEPTSPEEQQALTQFLASVFHARPDAPFLDSKLMHWKYFEPLDDWPNPRSFVLRQQGQIAAHAGIFPITFLVAGREVRCIHLIDWAAIPSVPGAGVLVQRKLTSLTDTFLTVGGSKQTRQILPKLGFSECPGLALYAKVIRPWSQAHARGFSDWKAAVRLARNAYWSLPPLRSVPKEWSASQIGHFDESTLPVFNRTPTPEFTACKRTPSLLNYMLRCPGARFAAFLVKKRGEPVGYFMLDWVNRQCRLADLFLLSTEPADWDIMYSLATRTAADDSETCEVEAAASTQPVAHAISRNGFRLRDSLPVFLNDPKRLLPDGAPLLLNLIEGEASYLNDPAHLFLT